MKERYRELKKFLAFTMALIMLLVLCGCGNKSSIDKQKLCEGIWVQQSKENNPALYIPMYFTDVYDFSEDGTFTYSFYSYYLYLEESISKGTYRIDTKNQQIMLTYEADETGYIKDAKTIPYYINEYNKSIIFSPDNDGNSNYKNYSSLDRVSFSW